MKTKSNPENLKTINKKGEYKMPLYRITTKRQKICNGVRIEPGLSVEIVTNNFCDPIISNEGKQQIANAFHRLYGIDMEKAMALNALDLKCEKIK